MRSETCSLVTDIVDGEKKLSKQKLTKRRTRMRRDLDGLHVLYPALYTPVSLPIISRAEIQALLYLLPTSGFFNVPQGNNEHGRYL